MSYSFSVTKPSKDEAVAAVREELAKVAVSQPIHKQDCDQAQAAANAFIALLTDDPSKDVVVSVSGYVSWNGPWDAQNPPLNAADVHVTASLTQRAG